MRHARVLTTLICGLALGAPGTALQEAPTAGARLDALFDEYRDAMTAFHQRLTQAGSEAAQAELFAKEDPARIYAARVWELVAADPASPVGLRGLLWIVDKGIPKDGDRACGVLARHHARSKDLDPVIARMARTPSVQGPVLLQAILADHPDAGLRGRACLALGRLHLEEIDFRQQLQDPGLRVEIQEYFGEALVEKVLGLDEGVWRQRAVALLERAAAEFAEVPMADGGTVGEGARKALFEIRQLQPGSMAPEITGEDLDGESFRLSEHRGKVVMLDFWGHW